MSNTPEMRRVYGAHTLRIRARYKVVHVDLLETLGDVDPTNKLDQRTFAGGPLNITIRPKVDSHHSFGKAARLSPPLLPAGYCC